MCYHLEVLVLGLLSTDLFWEGVQCDIRPYQLHVQPVTIQEGLCVFIPCNFTYDPANDNSTSKLYGYWFKASCSFFPAVATNDPSKTVAENARNHFFLSEKVEQGNCSLVINDAQINDGGNYCFRMEKGRRAKYSFPDKQEVTIKERQTPVLTFSGHLRANHCVNITCTAPGSCSLKSPHIFCKVVPRNFTLNASKLQSNGAYIYTMLDFIPLAADDKQKLTCTVSYGTGSSSISMEASVLLNVRYPPQMVHITGEIMESNKSQAIVTDIAEIVVKKGNSVTLHCKGEGNPSPTVIWLRESQSSTILTTDSELKFANMQIPDVGTYTCQRKNSEGVAYKSFRLAIQEAQSEDLSSFVPLLLVLCLNKVLLCFFFFFAIISFSTQRKAQVRRRVTKDIKKRQPARAPEEKETNRNSGSSTSI